MPGTGAGVSSLETVRLIYEGRDLLGASARLTDEGLLELRGAVTGLIAGMAVEVVSDEFAGKQRGRRTHAIVEAVREGCAWLRVDRSADRE